MEIEVDLSGRMEVLTADLALAFSNHSERTVLIPARVKRRVSQQLAARGVRSKMIAI